MNNTYITCLMFLGLEKGHELGHMDTYIIQKVLIYDLFPICIIKIRNCEKWYVVF